MPLPPLVDCHAHLCADAFREALPEVLARAEQAGVERIFAVGETVGDALRTVELAREHPQIKPCAGLYPTHLDATAAAGMLQFIRDNRKILVGIGEVGLDYWKVKEESDREIQRDIFSRFIHLSVELDLPLNVHSRSAGRHAIAFLIEHGARRVHLHAFDGKAAAADPAVEAGYYFSIPASILHSPQKQKLAAHVPLDRLLLETDAPVLGPNRDVRNEPANVRLALAGIAKAKDIAEEDVAAATTNNAKALYPRAFA
jgi:TatD DNase family protein